MSQILPFLLLAIASIFNSHNLHITNQRIDDIQCYAQTMKHDTSVLHRIKCPWQSQTEHSSFKEDIE